MKLHIPFLSLALTCTLGLFATGDHLAYLKTQPMIETSIVNLNVENVRSQIASIDLPGDIKADILKNLKITAKTIRTKLRLQLLEESQKSRVWAGLKAATQIYVVAKIFGWTGKTIVTGTLQDLYRIATHPFAILFPVRIESNKEFLTIASWAVACVCSVISYAAIQNTKFAYYGTSLIRQKLAKIDLILDIIESAQQSQS